MNLLPRGRPSRTPIAMKLKRRTGTYGRLHRFWPMDLPIPIPRWWFEYKIYIICCSYWSFLASLCVTDRPVLLGLYSSRSPVRLSGARHHLHRVWFTIPGKNWFACVCLYKIHILFCVPCESFNLIFILWWYSLEYKIHDQHVVIVARNKRERRVYEYFFYYSTNGFQNKHIATIQMKLKDPSIWIWKIIASFRNPVPSQ